MSSDHTDGWYLQGQIDEIDTVAARQLHAEYGNQATIIARDRVSAAVEAGETDIQHLMNVFALLAQMETLRWLPRSEN